MLAELGQPRARGCLKECEHPFSWSSLKQHLFPSIWRSLESLEPLAVVKGSSPKVLLGPQHQLLCLEAKDFWEAQGIGLE